MADFKPKYSPKEQMAYHHRMSKQGAVAYNKETGEQYPLSDFARGVHHQKAVSIYKARGKKQEKLLRKRKRNNVVEQKN